MIGKAISQTPVAGTEAAPDSKVAVTIGIQPFLSPARGLGIFRGGDPRVTLAALAHPGLNSVAAPRLVDANKLN